MLTQQGMLSKTPGCSAASPYHFSASLKENMRKDSGYFSGRKYKEKKLIPRFRRVPQGYQISPHHFNMEVTPPPPKGVRKSP